jgi:hypothetical protein
MLSIFYLTVYLLFCLRSKSETILCSLLFLLPLHAFLKQCVFFIDGDIGLTPVWREIAILMYAIKIFLFEKHHKLQTPVMFLSVIFALLLVVYYFIGKDDPDAQSTLRIYLSLIVLLNSMSVANITKNLLNKLVKVMTVSVFIIAVSGILQHFFFSIPVGLFMNAIEIIEGNIKYATSSFHIMGFERMYGIVEGGPNMFGVGLSFSLSWMMLLLFKAKEYTVNRYFLLVSFLSGIFCLMMSFSRAGWILFVFVFLYHKFKTGNIFSVLKYLITGIFVLSVLLIIVYMVFPDAFEVYIATFTMQEGSVATRGEMVRDSYESFLNNPFGLGLGYGIADKGGTITESSFVLFAMELGIAGIIFLFMYIFFFLKNIWKNRKHHIIYSNILAIVFIATVVAFVSVNILRTTYTYYLFAIMGLGINPSFKYLKRL